MPESSVTTIFNWHVSIDLSVLSVAYNLILCAVMRKFLLQMNGYSRSFPKLPLQPSIIGEKVSDNSIVKRHKYLLSPVFCLFCLQNYVSGICTYATLTHLYCTAVTPWRDEKMKTISHQLGGSDLSRLCCADLMRRWLYVLIVRNNQQSTAI